MKRQINFNIERYLLHQLQRRPMSIAFDYFLFSFAKDIYCCNFSPFTIFHATWSLKIPFIIILPLHEVMRSEKCSRQEALFVCLMISLAFNSNNTFESAKFRSRRESIYLYQDRQAAISNAIELTLWMLRRLLQLTEAHFDWESSHSAKRNRKRNRIAIAD